MHERFPKRRLKRCLTYVRLVTAVAFSTLASQAHAIDCKPMGSIPRIVALGDSMTAGEGTLYGSYRGYLADRASREGKGIEFVGSIHPTNHPPHEGWIGYEVRESDKGEEKWHSQLHGALTERIIKSYAPDIVILWVGSNYLCCTKGRPPMPDRFDMETRGFVSKVVYDVDLLLTQIFDLDSNVKVLLVGLPSSPALHPDYVDLYNNGMTQPKLRGLKDLIEKFQGKGRTIRMVEGVEKLLEGEKGHFQDELHPSDEGYKLISDVVYEELQKLLYEPSTHH